MSFNVSPFFLELTLLTGAFVVLWEWSQRRMRSASSVVVFKKELGGVFALTVLLFFGIWREFQYDHGFLALALSVAIAVSLLFPLGALGFFLQLLLVRPWELSPDPFILALPKMFAALTVSVWLYQKLFRRDDRIVLTPALVTFFAVLIWLLVAGFAIGRGAAAVDFLSKRYIPVIVLFTVLFQMPSKKEDLPFLLRMIGVGVCGVVLAAIDYSYQSSFVLSSSSRLAFVGLFGNANDLAAMMVVVFPFIVVPLLKGPLVRRPWMLVVPVVLLVSGIWLTQSRGAFLSIFSMGLVWFFLKKRSSRLSALPLLLIPVMLSLFVFRASGDMDGSSSSRWNYVVAGVNMAKSSPLFGIGVGQYPELYELFTPAFTEWGKRTAHSSWVLILAEGGVVGLFLFILLFLFSLFDAYRIRESHPEYLLCIVGYGVSMSLLSHTYIFLPYLVFGCIGAASRLFRVRITLVDADGETAIGKKLCLPLSRIQQFTIIGLSVFFVLPVSAQLRAIPDLDKPFGASHRALSDSLTLSGSRGEFVSFFLRLPKGDFCSKIQFVVSPKKKGVSFLGEAKFFSLPYIKTEHPSYPGAPVGRQLDPVLPVGRKKVCLAPNGSSWTLGEIAIEADAPPGTYQGKVTFGEYALPVTLTVWKMQMPGDPSFPFYTEMTTWYNLLGHYGKWTDGEAALARSYLQMLRMHRIETLTSRIADPPIVERGGKPYVETRTLPTPEQSFYSVNILGRPSWAYLGLPTVPREKVGTPESFRYLQAVQNSLSSFGTFGSGGRSLFYLWDEPQPEETIKFRQLLLDAHRYAPDMKVLVTTPYKKSLDNLVDIFAPVVEEIGGRFPTVSDYHAVQRRGKEFWWYVSCMSHGCDALGDTGAPDLVIDRPSVYIRSIGWIGPLLGTDAFLYYHANYGFQFYPKRDPWKSLWDFSGNGDGTLLYPGRPGEHGLTRDQPVASLRLKSMRQASFDAQYVEWMESLPVKPAWWSTAKKQLVTGFLHWERDFWKYHELRDRIGRYLNSSSNTNS